MATREGYTDLGAVPGWAQPADPDDSLVPSTDGAASLGTPTHRVGGLHLADGITGPVARVVEDAPVDAITETPLVIGSAAANSDLTFAAVVPGNTGITIAIVDPGADGALSVAVVGPAITITLAYAGGTRTTIASEIVTLITADDAANNLVTVTDEGDGSGLVDAAAATPMVGGVDGTSGDAGQILLADGVMYVAIEDALVSSTGKWKKWTLSAL